MHPQVFSSDFDKASLWDLELQSLHLGIAYLATGEDKYAKKLAGAVYDWFLNPMTYMTPFVFHMQPRARFSNVLVWTGISRTRALT
jgi:hypothetical protein